MKKRSKIPSIGIPSSQSMPSSSEKPAVKGKYQSVVLSQKSSGASRKSSITAPTNKHQNVKNEVKSDKHSKLPQARSGIPKIPAARPRVEKADTKDVLTSSKPKISAGNIEGILQKKTSEGSQIMTRTEASKPATRPLTPNSEVLKEIQAASVLTLSESQLNTLCYNLSELADRISPSQYNSSRVFRFEQPAVEKESSHRNRLSSFDRAKHSHINPPYLRKDKDTKFAFAKAKVFKTKAETETYQYHPVQKQQPKAVDTSGEESSVETGSENSSASSAAKLESKDSGYHSSGTWSSFSLDDNFKLDLKDEDNQELREGFADLNVHDKSSTRDGAGQLLPPENISAQRKNSRGEVLNKTLSDVQDRLELLIRGKAEGYRFLDSDGTVDSKSDNLLRSIDSENDTKEAKFQGKATTATENTLVNGEASELKKVCLIKKADKQSPDDVEEGRRRGPQGTVLKKRATLTSFRPPRTMEARQCEEGVVSMDEAGYMTCMNDIKAVKTMLLKLKRELQEAEVVSPLSRSYSTSRPSMPPQAGEQSFTSGKVMRRCTYDVGMMRERLRRARTRSMQKAQEDDVFKQPSPSESPTPEADKDKRENEALKQELKDWKAKYLELTKERDSIGFDKEELEHEMESKNHTIKMLQMQLEKQDDLDEVAYLKRQVKSLTEQVHQQQQEITQLRYRSAVPTPPGTAENGSPTMPGQKGAVKQEIRVRLRDAFVRHLQESSKSHALLSKQISRTESTLIQAQKGLKSLCSSQTSPSCTPCCSSEDINHCGSDSKAGKDKSAVRNSDPWTSDTVEKIVKTWKDTRRQSHCSSQDNSDSDSSQSVGPGEQTREISSRLQFL